MFFQRLMSSLILVPLILWLIFYANPWFLAAIALLILVKLAEESWQLIPLDKFRMQMGFVLFMLLSLWGCTYLFPYYLVFDVLCWVLIIFAILSFPASQDYWGYPTVVAVLLLLILPSFIQSLFHLYYLPRGKALLVYVLFLIWASDTGAYLSGTFLGKHKLIPQVSPGKSWEGVLGGLSLSMIVAWIAFSYFKPHASIYWFSLALSTVISAIFGDLFFSMLKRRCHLKDMGTIIPGHGGMLDRLDSLIAALPLFYLGYKYAAVFFW